MVLMFAKLSVVLTYFRIFGINRRLRVVIYVTAVIMIIFYSIVVGIGIGGILKCSDLANVGHGFCDIVTGHLPIAGAAFNVITDIWILSLPFPLLAKLQMRFKDKIGLIAVFAAGIL